MRVDVTALCLVTVLFLVSCVFAQDTMEVAIQVAPAQIVLKAPVPWLTVHADIRWSAVDASTVQINGLTADQVFADDCGNLVAKVSMEDIKPELGPPTAEITLTGATTDGAGFAGSATVRVK